MTGIRRTENTNLHIKVNKTFYYSFFSIYAALVLQNVITLSVNLADNMMLGAYSETSLAGVAAVNQIQFVFQQIAYGTGRRACDLLQPVLGKKADGTHEKIAATAMHAGLVVALLCLCWSVCFPSRQWVFLPLTDTSSRRVCSI
ncbi:hypothetical protein LC724_37885 [Blautia sp. RD014234]|nr:hypothetical protein [Blautia parvula]